MEVWKDIPGYENLYQVSTCGRVQSLDHVVSVPYPDSSIRTKHYKGRLLKPSLNTSGYLRVKLHKVGTPVKYAEIHQLVTKTFLGTPSEGQQVRHLNGIRIDNRLENLTYGTCKENMEDCPKYGKPKGKLDPLVIWAIRLLLSNGTPITDTANLLHIDRGVVQRLKEGKSYTWV